MSGRADLSWIEEESARKDRFPWQMDAIVERNRRIALYLLSVDRFQKGDGRLLRRWRSSGYVEFRRINGGGRWRRTAAGDLYLARTEEEAFDAGLCGCCFRPLWYVLDAGEIVDAACVWPECPDAHTGLVEEIHADHYERFNGIMSLAFRARGSTV